jgi:CheY-like chemotaxis protein
MASIGRLAALIGHEINNPLTYVLGELELLASGLEESPLRSHVDSARQGALRVRDIVRALSEQSESREGRNRGELRRVLEGTVPRAESARVLFIDDEQMIRNVAIPALHPYHVVAAGSGREAIAVLERGEQFDAILCDLHMTDLGGVDVYEWIVAHRPELLDRIVMMTGGAFTERAQRLLAKMTRAHLEKPFDLEMLRAAIAAILVR